MLAFLKRLFSYTPEIIKKSLEKLPTNIIIEITKYLCIKDTLNLLNSLKLSREAAARCVNFTYDQRVKSLDGSECIFLLKNKLFQEISTEKHKSDLALRIMDLNLLCKYLEESKKNSEIVLILSAICGYTDVMQILVKKFNIDPSVSDNQAIRWATQCRHAEIVKFLLSDCRVNPYGDYKQGIIWASQFGYKFLVKFLLQDKIVDPGIDNNQAIMEAVYFGQMEIVQLLLSDSRVNPADQGNQALIFAVQNGHYEMVKLLLKHPNVDPSVQNNILIKNAIQNGHNEILDLLMSDSRNNDSIWEIPTVKKILLERCCNRNI